MVEEEDSEPPPQRNRSPLPWCALCVWLSQPSPRTGPACGARSAGCGFVLAWEGAKCARLAWDGLCGIAGTEVSCWALQTLAEDCGESSLDHESSLKSLGCCLQRRSSDHLPGPGAPDTSADLGVQGAGPLPSLPGRASLVIQHGDWFPPAHVEESGWC